MSWLDKYPKVKALLQQPGDELLGVSREERDVEDPREALTPTWGRPVTVSSGRVVRVYPPRES